MGPVSSKDLFSFGKKNIDEACSNTSLSKIRYIAVEKPKWKVFSKRELKPIQPVPIRGRNRCVCGASEPCRQTVTPKGVTIHYPKKKKFEKRYKPPKLEKSYLDDKDRIVNPVKIIRPKKFGVVPAIPTPAWRLENVDKTFQNLNKRRRRRWSSRKPTQEPQPSEPPPEPPRTPKGQHKPETAEVKPEDNANNAMKGDRPRS